MSAVDTADVLALLRRVADEVIMPRWRTLEADQIHEKGPGDLVTDADREAERAITAALQAAFPDAVLLGEEAYAADAALLERYAAAPHAFTIDPIDGTVNFVAGSEDFAVMVAELRAGQVVRSWIWQPAHGRAFVAERGSGARADGTRIRPPQRPGTPAAVEDLRGGTRQQDLLARGGGLGLGIARSGRCCGTDYPDLAQGRFDYLLYRHVWPWDHAPGALLVSEAGGASLRLDGSAYQPAAPVRPWLVVGATVEIAGAVAARLEQAAQAPR